MTNINILNKLPPETSYLSVRNQDCGRAMGTVILQASSESEIEEKFVRLLTEHFSSDDAELISFEWFSFTMTGQLTFSIAIDNESYELTAECEITWIY